MKVACPVLRRGRISNNSFLSDRHWFDSSTRHFTSRKTCGIVQNDNKTRLVAGSGDFEMFSFITNNGRWHKGQQTQPQTVCAANKPAVRITVAAKGNEDTLPS